MTNEIGAGLLDRIIKVKSCKTTENICECGHDITWHHKKKDKCNFPLAKRCSCKKFVAQKLTTTEEMERNPMNDLDLMTTEQLEILKPQNQARQNKTRQSNTSLTIKGGDKLDKTAEISFSDKIMVCYCDNPNPFCYERDVREAVKKILERMKDNKFTSQEVINFINTRNQTKGWISYEDVKEIIKSEMGRRLSK